MEEYDSDYYYDASSITEPDDILTDDDEPGVYYLMKIDELAMLDEDVVSCKSYSKEGLITRLNYFTGRPSNNRTGRMKYVRTFGQLLSPTCTAKYIEYQKINKINLHYYLLNNIKKYV